MAHEVKLGSLLNGDEQRDAIHIAVAPVIAAEVLLVGQHIGFVDEARTRVGVVANPIGIVDPFLAKHVVPEQRIWMVLYPQTITSLRHEWTHPAFSAAVDAAIPSKEASELWLRNFCDTADCPDYDTLIAAASGGRITAIEGYDRTGYANDGDYLHFSGRDAHGEIPPEFWVHVENVTGKKIPRDERPGWFSCSC